MVVSLRLLALALTSVLLAALSPLPVIAGQTVDEPPIARFHRVDEHLFRGAQPTEAGLRHLRDLGVRAVINLRAEGDAEVANERRIAESLGMRFVHIAIRDGNFFTWFRRIPEDTVKQFFDVLDTTPGPLFIHCRRGTDRTGAIVAFYRIARNGWNAERALREANERGMRLWYRGLRRQIKAFDSPVVQSAPPTR